MRLSGAIAGSSAIRSLDVPVQSSAPGHPVVENGLGEDALSLVDIARDIDRLFGVRRHMSEADLMASLQMIAKYSDTRSRWLTAFRSPLGHALMVAGCDLNTAIGDVLAALPRPRS